MYTQSGYNIGLVMELFNPPSEAMILKYLGLNQKQLPILTKQKKNRLENFFPSRFCSSMDI